MEKWTVVKLGNIAKIKGGKRLPPNSCLVTEKNSHPYIRIRDLSGKRVLELNSEYQYVENQIQKKIERYTVNSGDILISIVGTVGLVAIIGGSLDKANLTENCVKLVELSNVDRVYLYYFLVSEFGQSEIRKSTVGAVQAKLPIKNLQSIPIFIPSPNSQKKISNTLSCIDDKIELNNRVNDNLAKQAYTIYRDMFVDNADHKWQIGTISDLGTVVGGSTPSKAKSEYFTNHGTAWITPKDLSINKNKFIAHGEIDITDLGLKNSSTKVMPKGTVLFSSRAPIGYTAIAKCDVTTNQGFKSVIPNINIGTAFIYYFLKDNLSNIESIATGSTFKEVSGSTMKSIKAIIPDDETLIRFSNLCKPIFDLQESLESENSTLSELRDFLLPKLMSGEIDVSEITN